MTVPLTLTCGKCSVSRSFDGYRRWCDACHAYFEPSDPCKYPTTEHMIYARDWYVDLARRLTEAITMREAEARKELIQGGQGQA